MGYRRAVAQHHEALADPAAKTLQRQALDPSLWTFRGPTNVGGRSRALLIDPRDPNVMYAGGTGGGVWKSLDAGASWQLSSAAFPSLAVNALAMDPRSPDVLYAGTGEDTMGLGVMKSSDGGRSWQLLAATASWRDVSRIAISPGDSRIVLAATNAGLQRSANGGRTWTRVLGGSFSDLTWDVDFDPRNARNVVAQACLWDRDLFWFRCAAHWSRDAGLTWSKARAPFDGTGPFERYELTYSRSESDVVYLLAGASSVATVWRSADGGQSYARLSTVPVGQLLHNATLWVDPIDPRVIVLGAVDVYRSGDGGVTWQVVSGRGQVPEDAVHADVHCAVEHPGYDGAGNRQLFFCTDGGIYRANDARTMRSPRDPSCADLPQCDGGWRSLNAGLATALFYSGRGSAATGLAVGGTQDNGTLASAPTSSAVNLLFGGDGGYLAIYPRDPNRIVGTSQWATSLWRVERGAASGYAQIYLDASFPDTGRGSFVTPLMADPNAPDRLWIGGRSLWRSENAWTATRPTWRRAKTEVPGGDPISTFAIAPGNSNVVWVAGEDARVQRSANALAASPRWTAVDDNGRTNPFPYQEIYRIHIADREGRDVIVALGGFSDANLRRSRNGGGTWTDISGAGTRGLPFAPVRAFAVHPVQKSWYYAGTDVGLYFSTDAGLTWAPAQGGPGTVAVTDLSFNPGSETLVVATYGRGLWTVATAR